ncbi:dihydrofolate reductase [Granulibacter bethesdensis]|uniref:dihydrofolate reductase n=1 Tax=Granulibacter bethesdensis TaxID=364410 RepID=UPI00093268EC|nr:dihydrofolate reductase [Granulibacter bethesdensis]
MPSHNESLLLTPWPSEIRSMCAIGSGGQLGLNGELPWQGDQRPAFREDVRRFWERTRGHVLICGPATYRTIPATAFTARDILELRSSMQPEDVLSRYPGRIVYIGGGLSVWDTYARFIQHWDITRLPYDGPADRYFDPAWLATGAGARETSRP